MQPRRLPTHLDVPFSFALAVCLARFWLAGRSVVGRGASVPSRLPCLATGFSIARVGGSAGLSGSSSGSLPAGCELCVKGRPTATSTYPAARRYSDTQLAVEIIEERRRVIAAPNAARTRGDGRGGAYLGSNCRHLGGLAPFALFPSDAQSAGRGTSVGELALRT
jgi:hypothetical protein